MWQMNSRTVAGDAGAGNRPATEKVSDYRGFSRVGCRVAVVAGKTVSEFLESLSVCLGERTYVILCEPSGVPFFPATRQPGNFEGSSYY